MIVYKSTKQQFRHDVFSNSIETIILEQFRGRLNTSVGPAEIRSWKNSLSYMDRLLEDAAIPDESGVAIEYRIPHTAKRVDFILTGKNDRREDTAIVIELKQWSEVAATTKDAIVRTYLGGSEVETSHPSYQAWTYVALLQDFNTTVQSENISLHPCAYLHNCSARNVINAPFYAEHVNKAPAFLKEDAAQLRAFIKEYIRYGDSDDIMYRIENGKIKPSKSLADALLSMLQGNTEFLMIDDQKLVFEKAMDLARQSSETKKHVLIVEGGPGTGKSVVAVNLLVKLTEEQLTVQYVSKNAAPRAVYESKLTGTFKKGRISNLFKGSGGYTEAEPNTFDMLVVDEAHRLNEKSGLYQNLGENQILEIIRAAKCSIFFIDEDQRVTWKDIGEKNEIRRWAQYCDADVQEMGLRSQFRCNGSDGYLAWLDNILQIRETANEDRDDLEYQFMVCDSPNELRDLIYELNKERNMARIVAGYCWDWASKKNPLAQDIEITEHGFIAQWNLASDGSLWIVKPDAVKEVGCIHTCQGLELDYIGVIIGPDLIVRDGRIMTDGSARSKNDASMKGYKSLLKTDSDTAEARASAIIKNTYRTLMTRGQKGCFVFATDRETNAYFKEALGGVS